MMGLVHAETVSQLVGPQWTLGEWFFLTWAALMTLLVCLMFVWWLGVQFFDPEDFEAPDETLEARLGDWVEVN